MSNSVQRRAFLAGLGTTMGCGWGPVGVGHVDGGGGGQDGSGGGSGGGTDSATMGLDGGSGSDGGTGPHHDPDPMGCHVWGSLSVDVPEAGRWGSLSVDVPGAAWWCSLSVEV